MADKFNITLTAEMLKKISDIKNKRADIAKEYAALIESGEPIDWPTVNRRIIERWSMSGLIRIKTKAWQCQ